MKRLAVVALALLATACASGSAFRAGEKAERREDYNRAVLEYARALRDDPNNLIYRKSLERARLRASEGILVVPDTANRRREYEQQVVKTIYVWNADLREVIDALRVVLGSRRIAPLPGQNALIINDAPDKVAAAERIVASIDKKRAQ